MMRSSAPSGFLRERMKVTRLTVKKKGDRHNEEAVYAKYENLKDVA